MNDEDNIVEVNFDAAMKKIDKFSKDFVDITVIDKNGIAKAIIVKQGGETIILKINQIPKLIDSLQYILKEEINRQIKEAEND